MLKIKKDERISELTISTTNKEVFHKLISVFIGDYVVLQHMDKMGLETWEHGMPVMIAVDRDKNSCFDILYLDGSEFRYTDFEYGAERMTIEEILD